jgi:beta-alanine degradation protein BauB
MARDMRPDARHPDDATDPTPADPKHRVGTTLLFENDRVRVWEMVLRPGEESTRHVHESDYLFVYLTRSKLALMQDNSPPETSEQAPGFVQYTEVGSGITHSVKNVGDGEHREILVELKGPSRASRPAEPQTNEA